MSLVWTHRDNLDAIMKRVADVDEKKGVTRSVSLAVFAFHLSGTITTKSAVMLLLEI
jgi:hypothetical protein